MNRAQETRDARMFLLQLIDDAFDGKAWHGPNLHGPLRRVSTKEAVWRPRGGRHNIAEIVLHCAYWKYAVQRRVQGGKRGSFPLKGSNWFGVPIKLTDKRWREHVTMLDEQHRILRQTIATADSSQMCKAKSGKGAFDAHIYGVAMHDTYHAGQIRTIKALCQRSTTGE